MGQWSYIYSDTNRAMLDDVYHDSYLLVPPEFKGKYGDYIHEGCYDGYGHFGRYDVYELIAEWNRPFIPKIVNMIKSGEWHNCNADTDELMDYYYGRPITHELRILGISIACYDDDNARLKYPIKIVEDSTLKYENVNPTKSDPNQGWGSWDNYVSLDEVAGSIAEWLDRDTGNLPKELVRTLQTAYDMACSYM